MSAVSPTNLTGARPIPFPRHGYGFGSGGEIASSQLKAALARGDILQGLAVIRRRPGDGQRDHTATSRSKRRRRQAKNGVQREPQQVGEFLKLGVRARLAARRPRPFRSMVHFSGGRALGFAGIGQQIQLIRGKGLSLAICWCR